MVVKSEAEINLTAFKWQTVASAYGLTFRCATMMVCVWIIMLECSRCIMLLARTSVKDIISSGVGILGAGYGVGQRRLRKKDNARLSSELAIQQQKIDPHRTSSHLTKHGMTNPHDKI
jgi:hypothetical protein